MQLLKLDVNGLCAARIMLHLARRGVRAPLSEIFEAARAPRTLVTQTLAALVGAELVECRGGRVRLRLPAEQICFADILDAVEDEECAYRCPLGERSCRTASHCPLCTALLEAEMAANHALEKFTLADLLEHVGRCDAVLRC